MLQLCGLWLNVSKDGKKSISGNLGGVRVILLKNKFKAKDDQPDYHLYIAERQKKGASSEPDIEAALAEETTTEVAS